MGQKQRKGSTILVLWLDFKLYLLQDSVNELPNDVLFFVFDSSTGWLMYTGLNIPFAHLINSLPFEKKKEADIDPHNLLKIFLI